MKAYGQKTPTSKTIILSSLMKCGVYLMKLFNPRTSRLRLCNLCLQVAIKKLHNMTFYKLIHFEAYLK